MANEQKEVQKSTSESSVILRQEDTIKKLRKELKEAKSIAHSSDEIRHILYDISSYKYKKKNLPDLNKISKRVTGVPVLMLSDLHYSEVVNPREVNGVNEYNSLIAEQRINFTVDSSIKIVKRDWKAYHTEWFVLPLIGDMLSGTIHEELNETNDKTVLTSMLELADILIFQIEKLTNNFKKVYVPCVVGNHPRLHKKFRAKGMVEENYEYAMYKLIERHFMNNNNVIIDVSDNPDMRFDIFNLRFLLTHGHTLGGGGNGIAGILPLLFRGNYKKQSKATSIDNSYDITLIGHYHQSLFLDNIIVNGTTKGIDEYALNLLNARYAPASQNLFMVDRSYNAITYKLPVFCDEAEACEVQHTIKTYN